MADANNKKVLDYDGLLYFWKDLKSKLANKVDKVSGKGLSTNDYTTNEKTKLSSIAEGATKNTVENVLTSTSTTNALSAAQGKALDEKITALGESIGNAGYGDMMKSVYDTDNDGQVEKADDADKLGGKAASLYGLADGTNIKPTVTAASTRANLATNDTLVTIVGKLAKWFTDLKTVAWSGNYNDLSNRPTIPSIDRCLQYSNEGSYGLVSPDVDIVFEGTFSFEGDSTSFTDAYMESGRAAAFTSETVTITTEATADTHAVPFKQMKDYVSTELEDYTTTTDVTNTLKPYATTESVNSTLTNYAKKTDISNAYIFKGSVASYDALPTTGLTAGDVYNVTDTGANYAWTSQNTWDNLGGSFAIQYISNTEIDAILAQ